VISVDVHRQPIKEVRDGQTIRTKRPTETRRLQAEFIPARGIYVYFPFNDDRLFTKEGIGKGVMRDWLIDPKDVVLLHALQRKK